MSTAILGSTPRCSPLSALAMASALACLMPGAATAADVNTHFVLRDSVAIGGDGGWDCATFDPGSHRLFVTHGTHVVVVDSRRDSVVGDIPNTPGVHAVALAPERGLGWTSNGRDSSVTVFDLATLEIRARVQLSERNPDAIVYDAASGRVFVFNAGSGSVTCLDAGTNAIVATLALGGNPEFAVVDGEGGLFVNIENRSEVVRLDTRKLQVVSRWPLAPGEEPTGIALDRAHHRVFAACANRTLVMLDGATGKVLATAAIGERVDGAAFDPKSGSVLTSNGEGTLSVYREVDPPALRLVEHATTERGARTLALDETSGRVYLPTANFGPAPEPTPDHPRPRAPILPGTFRVLVMSPEPVPLPR